MKNLSGLQGLILHIASLIASGHMLRIINNKYYRNDEGCHPSAAVN
jgi:hypothetical protein